MHLIMKDGTVYYLLTFVGGTDNTDEEAGIFSETVAFTPSTILNRWWQRDIIAIDTSEKSEIVLCGNTVYQSET